MAKMRALGLLAALAAAMVLAVVIAWCVSEMQRTSSSDAPRSPGEQSEQQERAGSPSANQVWAGRCGSLSSEEAKMDRVSLTLEARRLYEAGVIELLRYDEQSQAIELYDTTFIEDDADGSGWRYEQDILGESVQIRKQLMLDRPSAKKARLVVYHCVEKLWKTKPHDARVRITVNGRPIDATLKVGWNVIEFDPACLKKGANDIVISSTDPSAPAIIPIADIDSIALNAPKRRNRPQRSAKSTDGGKTWSPKLGQGNRTEGEYMVRLSLAQYVPQGTCLSPVLDMADAEGAEGIKRRAEVRSVTVSPDCDLPAGTALECFIRTGTAPVFDAASWTEWALIEPDKAFEPKGRYFQVKLVVRTGDPLNSPALRCIRIKAEVARAATSAADLLKVEASERYPVIRSAIRFEYEPLDHPSPKKLRELYKLDEVVAGAKSRFERIVRLNHWVSQQWKWHPPDPYPNWDALELLEKQPNGESLGGFCGQYAIVMVQCCVAMGMQARYVFGDFRPVINGHEVVEVWSDGHGKWVLMDPDMDRYYTDRASGIPLNALDLHRAILDHWFRGSAIDNEEHNSKRFEAGSFEEFLKRGPVIHHGGNNAGPDWFDPQRAHLMWGHLNLMPRNNFFSKRYPIPKAHGMGMAWSWNGYWHWYDGQTSRPSQFARYTDRKQDFYWNLNQIDFTLEETHDPGVLRVTMETFVPALEGILVSTDGSDWRPSEAAFLWKLTAGSNTLRMKTRNTAGVEGKPSWVRVRYDKK